MYRTHFGMPVPVLFIASVMVVVPAFTIGAVRQVPWQARHRITGQHVRLSIYIDTKGQKHKRRARMLTCGLSFGEAHVAYGRGILEANVVLDT